MVKIFSIYDFSYNIMQMLLFKILIEYFVNLWYCKRHTLKKAYFKFNKEGYNT